MVSLDTPSASRSVCVLGTQTVLLCVALVVLIGCSTPAPRDNPDVVEQLLLENPAPVSAKFQPISKDERLEILGENGHAPYLIGLGDGLRITGDTDFLKGYGETQGGQLLATYVKPDGHIYLPEIGAVPAVGKTVVQLQEDIVTRLKKYKNNPFASVDVIEFRSQKFFVLGAVNQPGSYPVDGSTSLLGSLGLAGGANNEADLEQAYIVRQSKVLPVSLADMVVRGDMSRNITMQNGDLVFIPPREDAKVYVVGEVKQPGAVPMPKGRISLAAAVAVAGGIDQTSADLNQVRIFRGGWEEPSAFTISSEDVYRYGESIQLRSGDRIIVAPSSQATNARAASLTLPFVNTALAAILAATAVSNARD